MHARDEHSFKRGNPHYSFNVHINLKHCSEKKNLVQAIILKFRKKNKIKHRTG